MKKLLVFALTFLLPFTQTEAQEKVDSSTTAEFSLHYQAFKGNGEGASHRVFAQGYEYFRTELACGHWGWLYGEYQYVSGVWGLFCDPAPWLSLGAAYGAESYVGESGENQVFGRWATTVWVGTERTNLELYYENGPTKSPWTRADLWLYSGRHLSVGGIYQTGDGVGPRLQLALPMKGKWELKLWGAPVWNEGRVNTLLEARIVWSLKEPE